MAVSQRKPKKRNVQVGDEFGQWVVLSFEFVDSSRKKVWKCKCVCGTIRNVVQQRLTNGRSKNCGCVRIKNKIAKQTTHGLSHTTEYTIWKYMIRRCHSNTTNRHLYRDRGITVCDRWRNSFLDFLSDMGNRPSPKHTLDRINNNGNYQPSNVRWATPKEQSRNTRRARKIEFNGETITVAELCERHGVSRTVVNGRLANGWSIDLAISTPVIARTKNGSNKN